jgi:hypothetical protein
VGTGQVEFKVRVRSEVTPEPNEDLVHHPARLGTPSAAAATATAARAIRRRARTDQKNTDIWKKPTWRCWLSTP